MFAFVVAVKDGLMNRNDDEKLTGDIPTNLERTSFECREVTVRFFPCLGTILCDSFQQHSKQSPRPNFFFYFFDMSSKPMNYSKVSSLFVFVCSIIHPFDFFPLESPKLSIPAIQMS